MTRRLAVALALMPLAVAAQPTTGSYAIIGSYTINDTPGSQTDPHVSGDFVAYTSAVTAGTEIRLGQLGGADTALPTGSNSDSLSDISGQRVVFTRSTASAQSIHLYEIDTAITYEIDPVFFPWRTHASIGGDTVAWVDTGFSFDPLATQLVAYDIPSQFATQLTFSERNKEPAVAAGGGAIVWTRCKTDDTGCDVLRANRDSMGAWAVQTMTGAGSEEARPATDGVLVAYESVRLNAAGVLDRDLYYQPLGGGSELQVPFTEGIQQNASVAAGLIAFESRPDALVANFDLYLYDTNSGFFYQLTSSSDDERLTDIDFDPATGIATVVYVRTELGDENVYAFRFTLAGASPGCGQEEEEEEDDSVIPTCDNPGRLEEVASATVTRATGAPDVATMTFAALAGDGMVCVSNGVPTNSPTTSGRVILNGDAILGPRDFFAREAQFGHSANLLDTNELVLTIEADPGSSFTATVYGKPECGVATMRANSTLQSKGFAPGSLKVKRGLTQDGSSAAPAAGCSSTSGAASAAALLALSLLALRARRLQPDRARPPGRR